MLFYTTLFLTSLLVTLVIIALYNLAAGVSRKLLERRERRDPAAHLGERRYGDHAKLATKPWGKPNTHATPAELARTHPVRPTAPTPWGWPGSDYEHKELQRRRPRGTSAATLNTSLIKTALGKNETVDDWKHNVGKPIRDDRPALAGTVYKPAVDNWIDFDEDDN